MRFQDKRDFIAFAFFTLIVSFWVAGEFLISGLSWIIGVFTHYEINSFQIISSFLGIYFIFLFLSVIQVAILRLQYVSIRTSSHSKRATILLLLVIILPIVASAIIWNNQYDITFGDEHFTDSVRDIAKSLNWSAILTLLATPFFAISALLKKQDENRAVNAEVSLESRKKIGVKIKKGFCLVIGFVIFEFFSLSLLFLGSLGEFGAPPKEVFYAILVALITRIIVVGGSYLVLRHHVDKDSKISIKSAFVYFIGGVILEYLFFASGLAEIASRMNIL